jgi:G3E family GTPase
MKKVPITLLTGFLGAGKTTLLNRILTENHGEKIAVIVNEFGSIGIDDQLIKRNTNGIIEMTNGCLCCSVKDDTLGTMVRLIDEREEVQGFDRLIIETTGLANPIPFVRAFLSKPVLKQYYEMDGVVTVVDAAHALEQLAAMDEAVAQLAIADVILLNKVDLVDDERRAAVVSRIRSINPQAKLHETERSAVDVSAVLGLMAFDLDGFSLESVNEHGHSGGQAAVQSLVLREERPLDMNRVTRWIGEALMLNFQDLLRYKGILNISGRDDKIVFQGLHMHFENTIGEPWGDDPRVSEVVLIGRNLDPEYHRAAFAQCVAD